jgi:hypothetical protein
MDDSKSFEILFKMYLLFETENCDDLLFALKCITVTMLLILIGFIFRSLKIIL